MVTIFYLAGYRFNCVIRRRLLLSSLLLSSLLLSLILFSWLLLFCFFCCHNWLIVGGFLHRYASSPSDAIDPGQIIQIVDVVGLHHVIACASPFQSCPRQSDPSSKKITLHKTTGAPALKKIRVSGTQNKQREGKKTTKKKSMTMTRGRRRWQNKTKGALKTCEGN